LKGGEIIGLIGELGGGKTTFVKGLAKGLGIRDLVTSPSFVLIKEYKIKSQISLSPKGRVLRRQNLKSQILTHIDLYRLKNIEEIESLGLSDYLGKKNKICVIEWAEKIKNMLEKIPAKVIWVEFGYIDENTRRLKISNIKAQMSNKIQNYNVKNF
jgi:tRNA threonylcarbamoyladenosine biosynthesis protein TsaE